MSKELEHKFTQKVKVKELKEGSVVLELPNGQSLNWPADLLPPDVKEGQELRLLLHDKKTDEEERRKLAHALLNEIMESK